METDRPLNLLEEKRIELELELTKIQVDEKKERAKDPIAFYSRLHVAALAGDHKWELETHIKKELEKINQLIQERRATIEALKNEEADTEPADYPYDLGIALLVWRAIGVNGQGDQEKKPKERIKTWLKKHYPDLPPTTVERIAKVCNWDKNGGG